MRIYTTDGDNRETGYYTSLENAAKSLVECAFTEVTPIDEAQESKAVYHRKTDGMFSRPRWNFDLLEEVFVAEAENDDIMWFKYKAGK